MARIAGAVLAAGSGTRMGGPKADLVVGGQRLLERAVGVLSEAGCTPVIAVVRAGTAAPGIETVVNPDPARGMRSSLQLAVDAFAVDSQGAGAQGAQGAVAQGAGAQGAGAQGADGPDAVAVLLVDLPGVGVDPVRTVVDAWRPGRIAVATYGERRGHPIVMSGALWRAALAAAEPDEGARQLLRARPDLVDLVPVVGDPTDLDTPDDVRRWTGRT